MCCLSGVTSTPRRETHLIGGKSVDTLSPHANNGNFPAEKKCTKCHQMKPVEQFGKRPQGRFGLEAQCRECTANRQKPHRIKPYIALKAHMREFPDGTREKRCGICKQWKSLSEFAPNGKQPKTKNPKYRWMCKECDAQLHRENRAVHPIEYKDAYLRRNYDMTLDQYKTMLEEQGGVCKICGRPETYRAGHNRRTHSLSVDHCHRTGVVRGLLCRNCNQALGSLQEDADRARALVRYIEEVCHVD